MTKIIAANWKMNMNKPDVRSWLINLVAKDELQNKNRMEVIIFPPFTLIDFVKENSNFEIGGQNCSHYKSGAYTGEISVDMLKDVGCKYVLVGHSERRQQFRESNEIVSLKAVQVRSIKLKPLICIGETLEQRKNGQTEEILEQQLEKSIPQHFMNDDFILAYEPIWAIGTGITASSDEIKEAHKFINTNLRSNKVGNPKILYGGSVNEDNAKEIMEIPFVDGVLVGGASLDSEKFLKICMATN